MNTELSHVNRAASHAVATALAPKGSAAHGAKTGSAATSTSVAKSNVAKSSVAKSNAAPAATGKSSTSSAASDPGTITSNDFLTLLVSELKNQDPTQPTDPNAYITQLVGVNSLEQLIQINSGVTSLDKAATATTTTSTTGTTPPAGLLVRAS